MRFLVDPDGLMDLVDALTTRFSEVKSREALFRFERLMFLDLNTPNQPPYLSFDIANTLGTENYWRMLKQFCLDLTMLEYHVGPENQDFLRESLVKSGIRRISKLTKNILQETDLPHKVSLNWPRNWVKVVKYFPERDQLIKIAARFVDDLFLYKTNKHNKITWCEKTPQNIFHVDFLWELFPRSIFIHIIRDPRGVAQSVMNQTWGPNSLEDVCGWLTTLYERWGRVKEWITQKDYNYLEIKLEHLAVDPNKELTSIAEICGLKPEYKDLPRIDSKRVDYWKHKLSTSDIKLMNRELGEYIKYFGYEV
jgi:hypothetical protein